MKRWRLLLAALVALGTAAVPLAVMAQAPENQGSEGVSRIERAFSFPWKRACEGDACGVGPLVSIPVRMPADQAHVDVSLTATLEYTTSKGDLALIAASFWENGRQEALLPGRHAYRLGPSRAPTSTTLTWVRRNVPAAGREYTFTVEVWPPFSAWVRGRQLTVVVEMWSAGD
jgi:hypothetical protein